MIRNSYELKLMRESGRIAAAALKKSLEIVLPGVSELEVDKIAREKIYKLGGDLSYKTVPNYRFATCITVNEQVVHGIPTDRKFVRGDLVSVDLAVSFKGWHTDCAWSVLLGKDRDKEKFLKVGEEALRDGIAQAIEGNMIGDISFAIQSKVEGSGYHVVRSLVGHGIGKKLHEEPEIPGFGMKGTGMPLQAGMTIAIEVIYAKGTSDVVLDGDGWTYSTADGSWGGVFEMTVAVGKDRAEVLT
ncbi:type I methionyl aminopeptidase [Candidatus Daviesbacteria bacterium]|nr:type I methionyl aminopeptidase [Candidatus Daviesbacteria bacterium]